MTSRLDNIWVNLKNRVIEAEKEYLEVKFVFGHEFHLERSRSFVSKKQPIYHLKYSAVFRLQILISS